MAETSCNQLLIDTATYLLTINMPTLKSLAMSLYDITLHYITSRNVLIALRTYVHTMQYTYYLHILVQHTLIMISSGPFNKVLPSAHQTSHTCPRSLRSGSY